MGISVRTSTAPNDVRFLTADFAVRQAHQPAAVRNDRCGSKRAAKHQKTYGILRRF